jgi:uncharacterized UBP type Zn finger protein
MMTPGSHDAAVEAISLNGSAPHCEHLDRLEPVVAQSDGCLECRGLGLSWRGLAVCLTCGWVACSDDSPSHHALAHYEETDHPLAAGLAPGREQRWCYVHQRAV